MALAGKLGIGASAITAGLEDAQLAPCHLDLSRLLHAGAKTFFNNPSLADITLVCPDGRPLHCHSVILAAASRRFATALQQGTWQHGQQMPIKGVDSDALERLVSAFYSGECPLDLGCAATLYDAAVKLEVPSLPPALEQYLSQALQPRNCCVVLETCLRAGTMPLVQICNDFIRCRLADVLTMGDFASSTLEVAACVCKDLAQHSQLIALQAAVTWLSAPGRSHLAVVLSSETGLSLEAMQAVLVSGAGILNTSASSNLHGGGAAISPGAGAVFSDSPGIVLKGLAGGSQNGVLLAQGAQGNGARPVLQLLGGGSGGTVNGGNGNRASLSGNQQAVLMLPQNGSDGGGGVAAAAALQPLLLANHKQGGNAVATAGLGGTTATVGLGLEALAAAAEGERLGGPAASGGSSQLNAAEQRARRSPNHSGHLQPPSRAPAPAPGPRRTVGAPAAPARPPPAASGLAVADNRRRPVGHGPGASDYGNDPYGDGYQDGGDGEEMLDDDPGEYQHDPDGSGGDAQETPILLTGRRAPTQKGTCHVQGCNRSLAGLRDYYQRYKICEYHLKVRSVLKDGVPHRFCQQCGRFHPLSEFDGERRSCRTMLQRHCHRRAKQKQELAEVLAQRIAEKEAAAAIVAAATTGAGLPLQQLQYLAGAAAGAPLGGAGGGGGDEQQGLAERGGRRPGAMQAGGRDIPSASPAGGLVGIRANAHRLRTHSPPSKSQLMEAVQRARERQQHLLQASTSEHRAAVVQHGGGMQQGHLLYKRRRPDAADEAGMYAAEDDMAHQPEDDEGMGGHAAMGRGGGHDGMDGGDMDGHEDDYGEDNEMGMIGDDGRSISPHDGGSLDGEEPHGRHEYRHDDADGVAGHGTTYEDNGEAMHTMEGDNA